MNDELKSLAEKDVYEVVPLPIGIKALPSKWVYKIKRDEFGKIERYKSRYVAKGYLQRLGEEESVHAPTSSNVVLRILLAMAAQEDLDIDQLDVKTAFLNGDHDEDIYTKPPPGFDGQGTVWRLKKAIYGLKQAASAWHKKVQKSLTGAVFLMSNAELCLYTYIFQGERVHVLVHVDV
jgi:Reverse transcriptase (RNA-dependent DNA polymerase)